MPKRPAKLRTAQLGHHHIRWLRDLAAQERNDDLVKTCDLAMTGVSAGAKSRDIGRAQKIVVEEINRRAGHPSVARSAPRRGTSEHAAALAAARAKMASPPIERYSPSEAVRSVLRRGASTYDSPTEVALDLQLLRGALNRCRPGNEILAGTLADKIAKLAMLEVGMRTRGQGATTPSNADLRRDIEHHLDTEEE